MTYPLWLSEQGTLARKKWLEHPSQCETCKAKERCASEEHLWRIYREIRKRDRDNALRDVLKDW